MAALIGLIASTALGSKIVVPDPGNDVDTIQDALDIAQDGDVIEILPGEYRGNFTVTNVPNLVIEGIGDVLLDARPLGAVGSGAALVASDCPNLRISNLSIRNAAGTDADGAGLHVGSSDDVVLENIRVSGCQTYGIYADQCENLKVIDCEVRGCVGGLHLSGFFIEVRGCTVENDGLQGIQIFGEDAIIENSKVSLIRGAGGGIGISGIRPTIKKCKISHVLHAGTTGITTSGFDPILRNNKISGCETGMFVVYGANGIVKGNQISRCFGTGLRTGPVSLQLNLDSNEIRMCGSADVPAVWIEGDGHLLVGNRVEDCGGDGFQVFSSTCILRQNQALGNLRDGIDIDGGATGTILEFNVVKDNGGEGIDNGGIDTTLSNNVAKRNRIDFASDGSAIDNGGNSFDVTGAPAPEID